MKKTTKERFMNLCEPITETGCWIWTGAVNVGGYGLFGGTHKGPKITEKTRTAHRVAYELFKGPIPEDKIVLHSCDVRCCVNPAHLSLGTYKENGEQMSQRGRAASGKRNARYTHPENTVRGEEHHRCKVTEEIAFFIRYCGLSLPKVAERYGISVAQAQRIRTGQSWTHLPEFKGN